MQGWYAQTQKERRADLAEERKEEARSESVTTAAPAVQHKTGTYGSLNNYVDNPFIRLTYNLNVNTLSTYFNIHNIT